MDVEEANRVNRSNLQWLESFSVIYPNINGIDVLKAFSYDLIVAFNDAYLLGEQQ